MFTSTSGNSFHDATVKADIFRIPEFLSRIARLLNNEGNILVCLRHSWASTRFDDSMFTSDHSYNSMSCMAGWYVSGISQMFDFSKTGRTELWWYFWRRILPYPRVFLISVFCAILIGIFVLSSKQNFERTKEVPDWFFSSYLISKTG